MITEANGRGGLDNITAIVVRTESVKRPAPGRHLPGGSHR
jgi:hypothetical protein